MTIKHLRRRMGGSRLWEAPHIDAREPCWSPPPDPLQFIDYFERTPPEQVVMEPLNYVDKPYCFPMYLPYRDYRTEPGEVAGMESGFIAEALYPAFVAPDGFDGEVAFDSIRLWMLYPRTGKFWLLTSHHWGPLFQDYGALWEVLGICRDGSYLHDASKERLLEELEYARSTDDKLLENYCNERLHLHH